MEQTPTDSKLDYTSGYCRFFYGTCMPAFTAGLAIACSTHVCARVRTRKWWQLLEGAQSTHLHVRPRVQRLDAAEPVAAYPENTPHMEKERSA